MEMRVEHTSARTQVSFHSHHTMIVQDTISSNSESTKHAYTAFWFLGLINNFTFIVFLSAAEDILQGYAGATLVATVVPGLLSKVLFSLLVTRVPYYTLIFIDSVCTTTCSIGVALASSTWIKLALLSLQSSIAALGEVSFFALTTKHSPSTIGAWSSGTGAAGIAGAGVYLLLKNILGLSSKHCFLICSPFPLLLVIIYRLVLHQPHEFQRLSDDEQTSTDVENTIIQQSSQHDHGITKQQYIWTLLSTYMLPLALVYFSEFLINQGVLGTLTKFRDQKHYNIPRTYRTFQFVYQIGVFVSRSSLSFIKIPALWLLATLQVLNLIFFILSSIFVLLPNRNTAILFVFWEGLLGGGTFVNAFYRLRTEAPESLREWCLATTTIADTSGVSLAAFLSLWVEQAILKARS